MVYHYTTINNLCSILAAYKESEDKKYFTFWASNVLEQNDSEEMSLDYKNLHKIIVDIEKEKEENGDNLRCKLSNFSKFAFLNSQDQEEVENELNKYTKDKESTPYTMSFSRQEDSLLMWSIYANKGDGLCLVFDEKEFHNLKTNMLFINDDVRYGKPDEYTKELLRIHYDDFLKRICEQDPIIINSIFYQGKIAYKVILEFIPPFIKKEAFQGEREWRIAFFRNKETKVYTRFTNSLNTIHYVKVGLPVSALKNIVIGPCAKDDKVKELLVTEMLDSNIPQATKLDFFLKSKVPLRIL